MDYERYQQDHYWKVVINREAVDMDIEEAAQREIDLCEAHIEALQRANAKLAALLRRFYDGVTDEHTTMWQNHHYTTEELALLKDTEEALNC